MLGDWCEGRRYLGLDVLARSRASLLVGDTTEEGDRPDDTPGDQRLESNHRITW